MLMLPFVGHGNSPQEPYLDADIHIIDALLYRGKARHVDTVMIDGTSDAQVLRRANRNFWLHVTPGQHRVVMRGSAANVDSLEIPFPTPPRVIEASGDGWFIAGIKDRRLLSGSLQLTRLQTEDGGDGAPRWESSRFPPFVYVYRTVELGLDWRVRTSVTRIAPVQDALTLELPLVAGESVVTEDMSVADGHILVSMNPQQSTFAAVRIAISGCT